MPVVALELVKRDLDRKGPGSGLNDFGDYPATRLVDGPKGTVSQRYAPTDNLLKLVNGLVPAHSNYVPLAESKQARLAQSFFELKADRIECACDDPSHTVWPLLSLLSKLPSNDDCDVANQAAFQCAKLEEQVLDSICGVRSGCLKPVASSWLAKARAKAVELRDEQIRVQNSGVKGTRSSPMAGVTVYVMQGLLCVKALPHIWVSSIDDLELDDISKKRCLAFIAQGSWRVMTTLMHMNSHVEVAGAHLMLNAYKDCSNIKNGVTPDISLALEAANQVKKALCRYGNDGYKIADAVEALATSQAISLDTIPGGVTFNTSMVKEIREAEFELLGYTDIADELVDIVSRSSRPRDVIQVGMLRKAHGAVSVVMKKTIDRLQKLAGEDPKVSWEEMVKADAGFCMTVVQAHFSMHGSIPKFDLPEWKSDESYVIRSLRNGNIPNVKNNDYDYSDWCDVKLPKMFCLPVHMPLSKFLDDKSSTPVWKDLYALLPYELRAGRPKTDFAANRLLIAFMRQNDITTKSIIEMAESCDFDMSKAVCKLVAKPTFLAEKPRAFSVDCIKIRMYLVFSEWVVSKFVLPFFPFIKMNVAGSKLQAALIKLASHRRDIYSVGFNVDSTKWCSCVGAQHFILADLRLDQMCGQSFFSFGSTYMDQAGFISVDRYNIPDDCERDMSHWMTTEGSFVVRYGRMFEGKLQKKATIPYSLLIKQVMDSFATPFQLLASGDNIFVSQHNKLELLDGSDQNAYLVTNRQEIAQQAQNVLDAISDVFDKTNFKLKATEAWFAIDYDAFLKQLLHMAFNLGDECKKVVGLLSPSDDAPGTITQRILGVYSGGNSLMTSCTHVSQARFVMHYSALLTLLDRVSMKRCKDRVGYCKMFIHGGFAVDSPVPCVFDQIVNGFPDHRTQHVCFWQRVGRLKTDVHDVGLKALTFAFTTREYDDRTSCQLLFQNKYSIAYKRYTNTSTFLARMVESYVRYENSNEMIDSVLSALSSKTEFNMTLSEVLYHKVTPIDPHLAHELMSLTSVTQPSNLMDKWIESGSMCDNARRFSEEKESILVRTAKSEDDFILSLVSRATASHVNESLLSRCHRDIVETLWIDSHGLRYSDVVTAVVPSPFNVRLKHDVDDYDFATGQYAECKFDMKRQNPRSNLSNFDYAGVQKAYYGVSRRLRVQDRENSNPSMLKSYVNAMDIEVLMKRYGSAESLFLPSLFRCLQRGLTNESDEVLFDTSGSLPHSSLSHKPMSQSGDSIYPNYGMHNLNKFVASTDKMPFTGDDDSDVLYPHSGSLASCFVLGFHTCASKSIADQKCFAFALGIDCQCCIKPVQRRPLIMIEPLSDKEERILSQKFEGFYSDVHADEDDQELGVDGGPTTTAKDGSDNFGGVMVNHSRIRTAKSSASSLACLCIRMSRCDYQDVGMMEVKSRSVQATRSELRSVSIHDVLSSIRYQVFGPISKTLLEIAATDGKNAASNYLTLNCFPALSELSVLITNCNASDMLHPWCNKTEGSQNADSASVLRALKMMIQLSVKSFPFATPVFCRSIDDAKLAMKSHVEYYHIAFSTYVSNASITEVGLCVKEINQVRDLKVLPDTFEKVCRDLNRKAMLPSTTARSFSIRVAHVETDLRSFYCDLGFENETTRAADTTMISNSQLSMARRGVETITEDVFIFDPTDGYKRTWALRLSCPKSTSGYKMLQASFAIGANFEHSFMGCEHPGHFASLVASCTECKTIAIVSEVESGDNPQNMSVCTVPCIESLGPNIKAKVKSNFIGLISSDLTSISTVSMIKGRYAAGSASFASFDPNVEVGNSAPTRKLYRNIVETLDHVLSSSGSFIVKVFLNNPHNAELSENLNSRNLGHDLCVPSLSCAFSSEAYVIGKRNMRPIDLDLATGNAMARKKSLRLKGVVGISESDDYRKINDVFGRIHESNLDAALMSISYAMIGLRESHLWVERVDEICLSRQRAIENRFADRQNDNMASRMRYFTSERNATLRDQFCVRVAHFIVVNPRGYLINPRGVFEQVMPLRPVVIEGFRASAGVAFRLHPEARTKDAMSILKSLARIAGHAMAGVLKV